MAVTNDLVTDRRVDRHCQTLQEAGNDVLLIGRLLTESEPVSRPYATCRMRLCFRRSWRFYAEYNWRLFLKLLFTKADIVWANDTDTLPACWLAAWLKGCRLVMDSHELFPEVPELVDKPRVRRVWAFFERHLLPHCDARITVCQSIADYYRRMYGVEYSVVRNISQNEECVMRDEELTSQKPIQHSTMKTLLYQGAVNVGRGIDWAIDALEYLPQCRLVVAGVGDEYEKMRAYGASKPWADRVQFLGRVEPARLQHLTPQADVGLVMLADMGLNYRYALPNRVGDFVAAGVPMVVSDMPEMAAVVRKYGIGEVIEGVKGSEKTNAEALAEAVEKVLAREWSDADFAAARADMDWNKEKEKLIECVNVLMRKCVSYDAENTSALTQ